MHTKIVVHPACRKSRKFESSGNASAIAKKSSCSENRIDQALIASEAFNIFDDSWLEEEATKRDHPLIKRLCDSIKDFLLHNDAGILLSYCPGLPLRISEEIARISRDEPGGMTAGRFRLNIAASDESVSTFADTFNSNLDSKSTHLHLGTTSLSEARMIETFEIQIYLFPSNSVLSKLQSIVSSLRQKDNPRYARSRNISLLPDFVLTKQKLFRSNNNTPFIVKKSVAK